MLMKNYKIGTLRQDMFLPYRNIGGGKLPSGIKRVPVEFLFAAVKTDKTSHTCGNVQVYKKTWEGDKTVQIDMPMRAYGGDAKKCFVEVREAAKSGPTLISIFASAIWTAATLPLGFLVNAGFAELMIGLAGGIAAIIGLGFAWKKIALQGLKTLQKTYEKAPVDPNEKEPEAKLVSAVGAAMLGAKAEPKKWFDGGRHFLYE